MKRILTINCLAVFLLCSFFPADAMALGLGFNLTGGGGSTEWEVEQDFPPYSKWEEDVDLTRGGIGLILDTTVAKNKLFNYRLNIGYEAVEYDIDGGGIFETEGWFMAHDFGFGIIRKKNLRLWVGPELRFSFVEGEQETNSNNELHMLTVGIGPVVGLNLNFGKLVSLALKVGALSIGGAGYVENKAAAQDWDIEEKGTYTFLNVGLIFRIGDKY